MIAIISSRRYLINVLNIYPCPTVGKNHTYAIIQINEETLIDYT